VKPDLPVPAAVLAEVAEAAANDSGGLNVSLLGDFLEVVSTAVQVGTPITTAQLRAYEALADQAARQGVALRALLDLYLSSGWRLWRHLPAVAQAAQEPNGVVVAGEVMLHAVDDVAAALTEGYQLARRALVRAQEAARREFVDDLLSGTADVVSVLRRADGFGMDLSGPHAVAVIQAEQPFGESMPIVMALERSILGSRGDAQAIVATKQGTLVVAYPAPDQEAIDYVLRQLSKTLGKRGQTALGSWQIGAGRAGVGVDGIVTSYGEAREALDLAGRLDLTDPVVPAQSLLVYQVLLRDQAALRDLIDSTLGPLTQARGGAAPLLETLTAYFASGGNNAKTARLLILSERAVTYRLARVRDLTGHDPTDPGERMGLQMAVLGAKLLNWPSLPGYGN